MKHILRYLMPQKSIQSNIFIACSLVALFSIVIATFSTYINASNTIEKNAINYIYTSIKHADENMNNMMSDVEKISMVIITNRGIVIDSINSPNMPVSFEWYQEKKKVEDFLQSMMAYRLYISRIAVIGLNGKTFQAGGNIITNSMKSQPWVDEIIRRNKKMIFYNLGEGQTVTMARAIYYNHEPIGLVMIDFNSDVLKKIYDIEILQQSFIFTVTDQGEFVFNSSPEIQQNNILDTPFKDLFRDLRLGVKNKRYTINQEKYITVNYTSEYTGLNTIGILSHDKLIKDTILIRNQMINVIVIVFLAALGISIIASNKITTNLKKLKNTMLSVEKGDLSAKLIINRNDEVWQLSNGFNLMMDRINDLMNEIKEEELQKREADIKALQAQIEPHFIYNTLNTIKYLAKMQNVINIEEISGALVELLRSVLGNTRKIITVEEELDYVRSYILIQKYKYNDRITVIFDVEDSILFCKTLKLILQPVVENAYIHGVASVEQGIISIKVFGEEGNIKFVVTDNGVGMTKEQIDNLFNEKPKENNNRFSSVGIRNVDERIKLFYGEKYGMNISSSFGVYTNVQIIIPKITREEAHGTESSDC